MARNEIVPQYYNLYDSTKSYTELLFRAGKVLQSKELNELQSILKNQIKNVGNTILTDGDTVEGCQLIIADDRKSVTVTAGKIYLDGDVRDVKATTLNITGVGKEVIGAKLDTVVITPDEDSQLNDVATGYDNYNQDGAYRLKEQVVITLDDNQSSVMYNLYDGEPLSVNVSEDLTQLQKIQETLARRTFEESGNYKVSGLNLSVKDISDDDYLYVEVSKGKAYVRGYEVSKDANYTARLKRPTELREITNEPKDYTGTVSSYALNNSYVNNIRQVVAKVEVSMDIVRGGIDGGTDWLRQYVDFPVAKVVSVTYLGNTYVQGTDFTVRDDGIDWSIGGANHPPTGSSYQCTWTYNKTMIKNTDYKLTRSDDNVTGYVTFLDGGSKPVEGSEFTVNYNFMLYRFDTLVLDSEGTINIVEGQSDILRYVEISSNIDHNYGLALGSVLLTPMSNTMRIVNNNTKTITMLELYNMLQRLNDIEYNQAVTDLDQEAASGENATELKGIFTDGFLGYTKADLGHTAWDSAIDKSNQELTLNFTEKQYTYSSKNNPLKVNSASTVKVMKDTINSADTYVTNNYTEIVTVSQLLASGSIRINSYNAFPKDPVVTLDPSINNWPSGHIEWSSSGETKNAGTIYVYWGGVGNINWGGYSAAKERTRLKTSYGFTDAELDALARTNLTLYHKYYTQETEYQDTSSLQEVAYVYMQPATVEITISNLEPNVDNVVATFDGSPIALTPLTASYKGTNTGSLKADAEGRAKGMFSIPENTPVGTRDVVAWQTNTPSRKGTATYTCEGTYQTGTTYKKRYYVTAYDPLAQSFKFSTDTVLTGIGLFFLDKDLTNNIQIQVREMTNGMPNEESLTYVEVPANTIKTSLDASQETVIKLPEPIYCRANTYYCFTVLTNSDVDSLWYAENGQVNISDGKLITVNPHMEGIMFSSSNAATWTSHQNSDLKFKLYEAQFQETGILLFDEIDDVTFDRIVVASSQTTIPTNCSCKWEYSINGEDWKPIEPLTSKELDDIAESVQIRCTMTGTVTQSPMLNLSGIQFTGFKNNASGAYISRNVTFSNGFNNIKVVLDAALPAGTNMVVSYATDMTGTTWNALDNTDVTAISTQYKTYTFEKQLATPATNYRIKIEMSTANSTKRPRFQKLRNILKTI